MLNYVGVSVKADPKGGTSTKCNQAETDQTPKAGSSADIEPLCGNRILHG
jgi:hypothetical protein